MDGSTLGAAIALIKKNKPTDEQIESAVSDWLDDHPEATTTVQDGSITKAKLDENLQGTVDDVSDLKNEVDDLPTDETAQELLAYEERNAGLTDTALAVIGLIFQNLPQDETATNILHSLSLECERLQTIYENWLSERSA